MSRCRYRRLRSTDRCAFDLQISVKGLQGGMVGSCPTGMDGAHGCEPRANSFAVQSPIPCAHETGSARVQEGPIPHQVALPPPAAPSAHPMKTADYGAKANQTAASESGTQQQPPTIEWRAHPGGSLNCGTLEHVRVLPSISAPPQPSYVSCKDESRAHVSGRGRLTPTVICPLYSRLRHHSSRRLESPIHQRATIVSWPRSVQEPRGIALKSQCAGTRSSTASASSPRKRGGTVKPGTRTT